MEEKEKNEGMEESLQKSKKMNQKLTLILCCVAGGMALLIAAAVLLTLLGRPKSQIREYEDSEFAPTYQGNIMEYDKYLGKDRSIKYCSDPSGYGMTLAVTDENREDFDAGVLFLCDYIQTIVDGDADAYNACFTEGYFEENERQKAFAPQMVYGTLITYQKEQTEGDVKLITYKLEYMIFENDGSFRRDILSNASRPQRIVLRISPDGSIAINELATVNVNFS